MLTIKRTFFLIMLPVIAIASCAAAQESANGPQIVAHRGFKKAAPENTLPAIRMAAEVGADYAEIDIRETADGEFVLMHNSTVDATTDGKGAVADMTLEQIKKLDAGSKFRKSFAGTEVPTLKEVFAFMKGKINAYVDFKAGSPEKFAAILKEYDMVEHSVVYSSLEQAAQLTKINSAIKVMPGIDETKLLAPLQKQYDLKAVETNIASLTKEYVEEAHRLGMVVFCDVLGFTDSKQSIKKAAGLGVDVIQTDNADIAIKYIKNMNMKKN